MKEIGTRTEVVELHYSRQFILRMEILDAARRGLRLFVVKGKAYKNDQSNKNDW